MYSCSCDTGVFSPVLIILLAREAKRCKDGKDVDHVEGRYLDMYVMKEFSYTTSILRIGAVKRDKKRLTDKDKVKIARLAGLDVRRIH